MYPDHIYFRSDLIEVLGEYIRKRLMLNTTRLLSGQISPANVEDDAYLLRLLIAHKSWDMLRAIIVANRSSFDPQLYECLSILKLDNRRVFSRYREFVDYHANHFSAHNSFQAKDHMQINCGRFSTTASGCYLHEFESYGRAGSEYRGFPYGMATQVGSEMMSTDAADSTSVARPTSPSSEYCDF